MWKCVECGKDNQDNRERCWNCETGKDGAPPSDTFALDEIKRQRSVETSQSFQPSQSTQPSSLGVAESREALSVMRRYNDAYLRARVIVSVGKAIQIAGAILALLILGGGAIIGSRMPKDIAPAFGILSFLFAGFVAVLFYIFGVLVSSQGQMFKATLDGAVNSSPFLNDKQRGQVMSL